MPGNLHEGKHDKMPKKLKQAQLPFKILSPVTPAAASGTSKAQPVKKRPYNKDDPGNVKAAVPKKPKTAEPECVEVTSSSDEPRASSPRRRPRALLDKFVRVESPVPEVSTSCDVVDLTSEDKENRAEPLLKDEVDAASDGDVLASGDAVMEKKSESEPVKTLDKADISEKATVNGDTAMVSEKEEVQPADNLETKSDDKHDVSLSNAVATPKEKKSQSGDESDVSQTKPEEATKTSESAATVDKDGDAAMSEPADRPAADEKIPHADSASAHTAGADTADDSDSAKAPEPPADSADDSAKAAERPVDSAADSAPADSSDSEKDDDADDESADDVEVLDDAKPKSAEEGAASGADAQPSSAPTTPSTKRIVVTKKKTPKQLERERIRAKREQEKLEEKQRRREEKQRIRKEKHEQKEKERKEKEEKREKERKEKEEKKEKERQEKEKEKLEKQRQKEAEKQKLIDEKRQAKEEEKNRKEEEKRKAEEEEQRKLQKAKSMFSSFFVKKPPKEAEAEQEEQKEDDNKLFQEFRVKEDMVLAPGARTALSAGQSSQLEQALAAPERPPRDRLYLSELRSGCRQPQSRSRTLPPLQKDLEIIEEDEDEERELDGLGQNIDLSTAAATARKLRYKLLMFHENRRPAYWGTWSKRCPVVSGRRPLGKAEILNYEEDSDDDWEEEDPNGESLSGSEKEVESEDDYEVDNEYFVPHGYLSDEEMKDEEEMISPEAQKARLKEKGEEFEKEMKKKTTALKPRLIGCVWRDDTNTDPMFQQLLKLLRPFAVRALSTLPVPTVASGEVASTPLAGPSPSETPASSAQTGLKFLKKFPSEALLPLARLVHGSTRGKPFLVREFAAFWKRRVHGGSPRKADPAAAAAAAGQTPPSTAEGTPTGGPLLSKKKIEDKLVAIASYTRCTAEGPLQGRCCWMVNDDVLASLGVELPLPSQWKWITKTAARQSKGATPGVSPTAAGAEVATVPTPERARAATSLITKFAKVVTAGQPAQPGIATFFKASPSTSGGSAGPSTSAAAGGTPKRRVPLTTVGPRPGPSGVSPAAPAPAPGRRLTITPVSAAQPTAARRLTPTAVTAGQPTARRLIPTPVTAGSASTSAVTPAPSSAQTSGPTSAPGPAQTRAPESAPRKITLISLPRGLPLARAAAAPVPAAAATDAPAAAAAPTKAVPAPTKAASSSGDVEMITLD
ncbi:chromatin assembly factor 1 subunit A-like isoform X2 [Amphibalanus amphitrite]|uniref:chromatin assembly factor 1 subunit A-like isoform X2 n=1 Tax=Amphibalanus amphitrite TaxID=1232801 RepID=UPI001C9277B9|nr:chromatin assembly factor 1 subunit A-like isoform X2 [Amphibalanus amphitrite]